MSENVLVFVGVYDDTEAAEADYEAIKLLHAEGVVGTYDAAVITKDEAGKVRVRKHEKPTQHGAWSGLAIGALVGILFPPSILAGGAIGAATGGLIGHLWGGMSRADMHELGETLDEGQASLLVIGESKLDEAIKRALERAIRTYQKEIDAAAADLRRELDQAIDEAGR